MFVGIGLPLEFGVEDSHGVGQLVVGHVVVADDEVDAFALGVCNLLHGLDAAIEGDDERDAVLGGIVDTLVGDAVTLVVAVGDVVVEPRVEILQELVYQRYGRRSVHVVIAINHNLFFTP